MVASTSSSPPSSSPSPRSLASLFFSRLASRLLLFFSSRPSACASPLAPPCAPNPGTKETLDRVHASPHLVVLPHTKVVVLNSLTRSSPRSLETRAPRSSGPPPSCAAGRPGG